MLQVRDSPARELLPISEIRQRARSQGVAKPQFTHLLGSRQNSVRSVLAPNRTKPKCLSSRLCSHRPEFFIAADCPAAVRKLPGCTASREAEWVLRTASSPAPAPSARLAAPGLTPGPAPARSREARACPGTASSSCSWRRRQGGERRERGRGLRRSTAGVPEPSPHGGRGPRVTSAPEAKPGV